MSAGPNYVAIYGRREHEKAIAEAILGKLKGEARLEYVTAEGETVPFQGLPSLLDEKWGPDLIGLFGSNQVTVEDGSKSRGDQFSALTLSCDISYTRPGLSRQMEKSLTCEHVIARVVWTPEDGWADGTLLLPKGSDPQKVPMREAYPSDGPDGSWTETPEEFDAVCEHLEEAVAAASS